MKRKMTRREDYLKLIHTLSKKGEAATEDACAIEHSVSPETYSALKQLLNERQVSV